MSRPPRPLDLLLESQDLPAATMEQFIGKVMDGEVGEAEIAAVLIALRLKGESGAEVAAAARAMRSRAISVPVSMPERTIDTCGTGGDGAGTINISTAAALVVAAAGVPVAKHGNRSVSSRCGSADVLEASGVRLELPAEALARLHDELGIAFLFAPRLHPAMGAVMPVRRALGVRTVFNLLGPLTNPAGVTRQVVGVWGPEVLPVMADALAALGARHALVVHSDDGLDELSAIAPSTIVEVRDGKVFDRRRLEPATLGIPSGVREPLRGGDVAINVRRLEVVLGGGERSSAFDAVALNAAAGLYVAGVCEDLEEGMARAVDVLKSGAALDRLHALARRSSEMAGDG